MKNNLKLDYVTSGKLLLNKLWQWMIPEIAVGADRAEILLIASEKDAMSKSVVVVLASVLMETPHMGKCEKQ